MTDTTTPPPLTKDMVKEWLFDWHPEGWDLVHEEQEPHKHDISRCTNVYQHKESGEFWSVEYLCSYNYGIDDDSWIDPPNRVYPHTITTTVYKGEPQ